MITKRGWLVLAILIVFVVVFWNFKFLGLATVNTSSNFTIAGPNSAPVIGALDSSLYTCEDDTFYQEFQATDSDGDALTATISNPNPFFVFFISQSTPNTNTFAIVSAPLSKSNAGGVNGISKVHQKTITVNDHYNATCCNDTAQTNITVIEINHAPVIEDVGVKTIWTSGENSTLYEVVSATDKEYNLGYGTLNYNVSIVNATNGNPVNLFGITSPGGVINFIGNSSTPIGNYNITVCVNDTALSAPDENISLVCGQNGGSSVDCDNFTLTVTDENRAPNITNWYPVDLNFTTGGTTDLEFNITMSDPDGTFPDAYWFIDNVFQEKDSGASTSNFSYIFGCGVSGNHIVKIEITDGLLNDSLQWNVSVNYVSCSSGGGGGGGGGGGVSIDIGNFEVNPEFITATVLQDEGQSFDVKLKNIGGKNMNIQANVSENITDVALLNEKEFVLHADEEKTIRVYLYALRDQEPGIYYGEVVFGSGPLKKIVKIVLSVKKKEALFDLSVNIPDEYKTVTAGSNVKALVDMLNVGLYGTAVDVELYLYISDFNKLILYETQKEVLAVKTNLSVERDLFVPLDTVSGTYLVVGEAKYKNITVSSFDTFNVVEKKYVRVSLVLIILVIVALILLILFILWKRRKDRKERGYR